MSVEVVQKCCTGPIIFAIIIVKYMRTKVLHGSIFAVIFGMLYSAYNKILLKMIQRSLNKHCLFRLVCFNSKTLCCLCYKAFYRLQQKSNRVELLSLAKKYCCLLYQLLGGFISRVENEKGL